MAYSVNTGVVTTASPTTSTDIRDVSDAVAYLDVDNTQFTTMTVRMPQEPTGHWKKEWVEDQLLPNHTALSATISNSLTDIPVTTDEGQIAKSGDVARNSLTGEAFLINSAWASSWSVTRGFGGTVAAVSSASVNAKLVIVGNVNEQYAGSPTAIITKRSLNYNYTGIFRNTMEFAGTQRALSYYGDGSIEREEKRKKLIEHKWLLERAAFFGARANSTGSNGRPMTSAGGLNEYITTNRATSVGTLDKATLQDRLRDALQYGDRNRKVMFAAPLVVQVLGELIQDNWVRATPDENVFGVKADFVISAAFGARIPVYTKADWMRYGEASGNYGGYAFLVDMSSVRRCPLKGQGVNRDTHFRDNIQTPDADGRKAEYLTEVTWKFANEKAHAVWTGITG